MAIDFKKFFKLIFPVDGTELNSIFNEHRQKVLAQLIKYQDYYDNEVFQYIVKKFPEYDEQRSAQLSYRPSQIPINYSRMIVNKLSSFQFTEPISFQVKKKNGDTDTKLQKVMEGIHDDNNMNLKLMQSSQEANISGGVGVKLVYNKTLKQVEYMARPRMETWVDHDVDDVDKINKVHFAFFLDGKGKRVWKQTWELRPVSDKKDAELAVWLDEAIWELTDTIKLEQQIFLGFVMAKGKFLTFLPVYIIPNLPQVNRIWGLSELRDLIPIIDELVKKTSDSADALRFEMFAITIMLNMNPAKQNDKEAGFGLKTKPGAMWSLVGGSPTSTSIKPDIFKLESKFSYVESLKTHMGNLKSLLFELSSVVQLDDKLSSLGPISGVALKLLFANMAIKTNNKNTVWDPKLERIYLDMLRLKGLHEGFKIADDTTVDININSPVPQNEVETMQVISAKIASNLISIETAMKAIGIVDTEAEMAKILAEGVADDELVNDIMNRASNES